VTPTLPISVVFLLRLGLKVGSSSATHQFPVDVLEDRHPGLAPALEQAAVDELALKGREEALGHGISNNHRPNPWTAALLGDIPWRNRRRATDSTREKTIYRKGPAETLSSYCSFLQ
jgi:hypothetical protein